MIDRQYSKLYFTRDRQLYNYRDGGGIDRCVPVTLTLDNKEITMDEVVAVMNIPISSTPGNHTSYVFVSTYSDQNKGTVYITEPDPSECSRLIVKEVVPVDGRVKSVCYWSN